jgi:glutathione S-transferase
MAWVDIVALLAIGQLIVFGVLVARARGRYGVAAPATGGHPVFERYFRVQMNTVEILLAFVPALFIAARYWPGRYVALIGAIYLIGRIVYLRAYVREPGSRTLGFALSMLPTIVLALAGLAGALRSLLTV